MPLAQAAALASGEHAIEIGVVGRRTAARRDEGEGIDDRHEHQRAGELRRIDALRELVERHHPFDLVAVDPGRAHEARDRAACRR